MRNTHAYIHTSVSYTWILVLLRRRPWENMENAKTPVLVRREPSGLLRTGTGQINLTRIVWLGLNWHNNWHTTWVKPGPNNPCQVRHLCKCASVHAKHFLSVFLAMWVCNVIFTQRADTWFGQQESEWMHSACICWPAVNYTAEHTWTLQRLFSVNCQY